MCPLNMSVVKVKQGGKKKKKKSSAKLDRETGVNEREQHQVVSSLP